MSESNALNGNMRIRAVVDTTKLDWTASPSGTVERKRVHLVGGPESGQVTSVVRYLPGAAFPEHDHPEGEEIFVLEGTFSDQLGHATAGMHVFNPEGHRHAPYSEEGCLILVKLRQYAGEGRTYQRVVTGDLEWQPTHATGVRAKLIYEDPRFPDRTSLEEWEAGASPGPRVFEGGVEIFVIEGELTEGDAHYQAGTWLRCPDGDTLDARTAERTILYVKTGGVVGLRSA